MTTVINYSADPVEIVAKTTDQMGVTIELGAVQGWQNYLDDEVENGDLTDENRIIYEERFDGY